MLLGVLGAFTAVLTGNQAADVASAWENKGAIIPFGLISEHEEWANITLWFFTAVLVLRTISVIKKKFEGKIKIAFVILAFIGVYFVYETGEHGGKLVYDKGVGTELKKQETE